MADEIRINAGLTVTLAPGSSSQQYQSLPNYQTDDIVTVGGPTPGTISVAVTGTDVNLSALTDPGWCRVQNLDITNFVTLGIYDGATYFPFLELGPEQFVVVKLYRDLGKEFVGTGSTAGGNTFRIQADTAACKVKVEAFER